MSEAFGFSFHAKRSAFGIRYDIMYTTYMYPMPTLVKKEAIYANNIRESLIALAQIGVIKDRCFNGVWLHAL